MRERELRDETRAFFCEKCDQEYLQAMDGIKQFNQTEQLERMLERLVQEQEGIETLVLLERQK